MAEGGTVTYSSKEKLNTGGDQKRIAGDGGISSNTVEVRGLSADTSQEFVEMYFENSRRSGGGDIEEVQLKDGIAYITFVEAETAQRVVSQSSHQVAGQTLTVTLYHPPPTKPCYDNRVLVQELNSAVTEELLTNFLVTETGAMVTEFLYGEEAGRVVVTFSSCIDFDALRKTCRETRIKSTFLQVARVAISNCILVWNLELSPSHEVILLYFENKRRSGGGEVVRVEMVPEERYCLVYFEDNTVIDRVLSQTHKINGADVKVHLHHECLGRRSSTDRSHLCFKISNIGNKDTATLDDKTIESSISGTSSSISSDHDKESDFVEVPEWQINDGQDCVISLLVQYRKTHGKKVVRDMKKVPCSLQFLSFWNFYTRKKQGQQMLNEILQTHCCSVTVSSEMDDMYLFEVNSTCFETESDFEDFLNVVLYSVYKCAQQSLFSDAISLDHRIQEDVQQRVNQTKDLDCAWIELIGEHGTNGMCIVCTDTNKMVVLHVVTEIIADAKKCFENHEEVVFVDFMWHRVMTKFGYVKNISDKFPHLTITTVETSPSFVVKGVGVDSKAAADNLTKLLETAYMEIQEDIFSPGCHFEILTYPAMQDYINNCITLPSTNFIWMPNPLTENVHIFYRKSEVVRGLGKLIKGCIKEKAYVFAKEDDMIKVEKSKSVQDLKDKYKGKTIIYGAERDTLVVIAADDIFESLDAEIQEIIKNVRAQSSQSACLLEKFITQPDLKATKSLKERKELHLRKDIVLEETTVQESDISAADEKKMPGATLPEQKYRLHKVDTKDKQKKESSICIATLHSVSEVEFRVMEILGNELMKNIKFSWNDNCILIFGPVTVEPFITQVINSMLEVLRGKQFEIFSLDELEKRVVRDMIEEVRSNDTICIFDEKNSQIVVYSDKQDDIMKFKHKLIFRSGKVKENGRRFTDVNKSQAAEVPDECFRSLDWSGGQGQQFSGSKDALDKAVFYTKENIKVSVYMANILNLPVDCIVNGANDTLQHGGGVAKVIADAAGYKLVQEGDAIIKEKGKIPVGYQVTTTAGKLPYKCVIHTVGPCWSDYQPHNLQKVKECEKDLYAAIYGCFLEAEKNDVSTVALPAVSSGIYAVPQDMCVVQYARAVQDYSRKSEPGKSLTEIHFVDMLPHLVKKIQDTFRTMLQDGKEPNYNVNNYVISSSGYQRQLEITTIKGHQSHEHHQHVQAPGLKNAGNSSHHGPIEKIDFSPVYYESGEHGKKQSVFQISGKPVVRIYKGNVLELKNMDALICPDDKNGSGSRNIASELKREEKYKKLKEAGFKKEKPGLGDVVVTFGYEHSYHVIFHVVIESYENKKSDFESVMRKCMDNILKKAHELVHVKRIAVPLFGVNSQDILHTNYLESEKKTGYLTEESWAKLFLDRFVAFCYEFKNANVEEIHIVTHFVSSSAYDKVKKIFRDYYEETSRDQNEKIVPPSKPSLPCGCGTDNTVIQEAASEKGHGSASVNVDAADDCVICMCPMTNPRTLLCGHSFCACCIDEIFKHKPVCPACGKILGILTGDQPEDGRMVVEMFPWQLAGYEGHGSMRITYTFPSGRQGPSHPTPGALYCGMSRTAYLPDTLEGRTVCRMLQLAFKRRLVFTISQSQTTGKEGLIWNDIHHKTNRNPGTELGYPDPDYLSRVKEELAAKGITEADLPPQGMI